MSIASPISNILLLIFGLIDFSSVEIPMLSGQLIGLGLVLIGS